jgi:voltage-gated potassium channel Kch
MHPVLHFLAALHGFRMALVAVWRDPETKALPVVVGILLVSGTIFYWSVEDWTVIQALYFSVVTLATVGYGDLTPTSDFSQIFTIIYIFIGLGVLVAFLSSLAHNFIRHKVEVADQARENLSAVTHHGQPPDEGGSQ